MTNVQSKFLLQVPVTCQQHLHPWTSSCINASAGVLLSSSPYCLRIYAIFYALSLLVRHKHRLKSADIKKALRDWLRSSGFLITNAFTFPLYNCLVRRLVGNFNRFTVVFVPALLASLTAIAVEKRSRRQLLALYMANVASETLWRMAEARGYVRSLPKGQYYIFAGSLAILVYLYRLGCHRRAKGKGKDPVYKVIQFIVGASEGKPIKQSGSGCPHDRQSCLLYCLTGGLRCFGVGFSFKLVMNLLTGLKRQGRRGIFNGQLFQMGLAVGGFSLLYRATSCLLRHWRGHDEPLHAIPATLLASLCLKHHVSNTLAVYTLWKMLQLVYEQGIERGIMPVLPGFLPLLYAVCTAIIFHASIMEPKTVRASYFRFLYAISGERLCKFHLEPFDAFGYNTSENMHEVIQQLKIDIKSPIPKYPLP